MQSGDALCLSQGANKKSVAPGSPETLKWLNAEALVQDEIVAQVSARQRSKERLCRSPLKQHQDLPLETHKIQKPSPNSWF